MAWERRRACYSLVSSIKDIVGESFTEDDADDQQKGDRNAMSDSKQKQTKIDTKFERPTETDSKETHTHTNKDTDTQTHTHTRYTDRHHTHTHTQSNTKRKTHIPAHTHTGNFTSVFDTRPSFRAKGLRANLRNHHFTSTFGHQNVWIRAVGRQCHVVMHEVSLYPSFRRSNVISCERVAPDPWKSQFYLRFLRSNLVSCERAVAAHSKAQFYFSFCDRISFRAKGLSRHTQNRNFTSVFGDRSSFRANGLRFVPSRWHCGHLQSIIAPARDKSKALFTSIRSSRKRAVDACHATTPKAPPGPQAAKLSRIIQETSTSCICRGMQELHNAHRLPEICMSTLLRTALPRRFPPENGKPKIRAHIRTLI